MLGSNGRNILLHASKKSILYQWTVLGNYNVELVWIGTIKTNMSNYLLQDMWRVPCMNINKKGQQDHIMHHTNCKEHIMGPKLNGKPMRATNLSSHLKTQKYIQRVVGNFLYSVRAVDPTMLVALGVLSSA